MGNNGKDKLKEETQQVTDLMKDKDCLSVQMFYDTKDNKFKTFLTGESLMFGRHLPVVISMISRLMAYFNGILNKQMDDSIRKAHQDRIIHHEVPAGTINREERRKQ